jgi:hypothetical protein
MAVMKKISVLLIVVFLISVSTSFQQLNGQEKTKTEKEKEMEILKAIDEQKKTMAEQEKIRKETDLEFKKQQEALNDAMKNLEVDIRSTGEAGDAVRIYNGRRGGRSFDVAEPFIFTPGVEGFYGHSFGGDTERTTWDFSKSVKESTFSRDYTFDVEKTVNTVVMSVMGDCKAGEIRIRIVMPNGKNYSDIVIDEFGNLNWRKSFTISETENQDKAGDWKFQISSSKATGYFKISLQTY